MHGSLAGGATPPPGPTKIFVEPISAAISAGSSRKTGLSAGDAVGDSRVDVAVKEQDRHRFELLDGQIAARSEIMGGPPVVAHHAIGVGIIEAPARIAGSRIACARAKRGKILQMRGRAVVPHVHVSEAEIGEPFDDGEGLDRRALFDRTVGDAAPMRIAVHEELPFGLIFTFSLVLPSPIEPGDWRASRPAPARRSPRPRTAPERRPRSRWMSPEERNSPR